MKIINLVKTRSEDLKFNQGIEKNKTKDLSALQ